MRRQLLAIILATTICTSLSQQQQQPDPSLVPLIDSLLLNDVNNNSSSSNSSVCQLYQRLRLLLTLSEVSSRPQIEATIHYIQEEVGKKNLTRCEEDSGTGTTSTTEKTEGADDVYNVGILGENDENAIIMDMDSSNDEDVGRNSLGSDNNVDDDVSTSSSMCDNCKMSGDDKEDKDFIDKFREHVDTPEEVADKAKSKIIRIIVLCGFGAFAVTVVATLAVSYCVRVCVGKVRERQKKRNGGGSSSDTSVSESDGDNKGGGCCCQMFGCCSQSDGGRGGKNVGCDRIRSSNGNGGTGGPTRFGIANESYGVTSF